MSSVATTSAARRAILQGQWRASSSLTGAATNPIPIRSIMLLQRHWLGVAIGFAFAFGVGCSKAKCESDMSVSYKRTALYDRSAQAANREFDEHPTTDRRGWWHVSFVADNCSIQVIQICQSSRKEAISEAHNHLRSLRAKAKLRDGSVMALAPDETCQLNAVAYEEH
jgi:hypothetical protein